MHTYSYTCIRWDSLAVGNNKNNLKLLRLKKVTMVKGFMKWDQTNFFSIRGKLHFDYYCAPYIKKLMIYIYRYIIISNYIHI